MLALWEEQGFWLRAIGAFRGKQSGRSSKSEDNVKQAEILTIFLNRIHKRLIDLNAPTEVVKQIIINIEAGVEVEVTIAA